jgi:hypothetical protein
MVGASERSRLLLGTGELVRTGGGAFARRIAGLVTGSGVKRRFCDIGPSWSDKKLGAPQSENTALFLFWRGIDMVISTGLRRAMPRSFDGRAVVGRFATPVCHLASARARLNVEARRLVSLSTSQRL